MRAPPRRASPPTATCRLLIWATLAGALPPTPPAAATESALLAALWLLEAAHSAWRSPASVCLGSWTKHLGAFAPEVRRAWALPAYTLVPWEHARTQPLHAPTAPAVLHLHPALPPTQLVARLTQNWPEAFRHLRQALVDAQVRRAPGVLFGYGGRRVRSWRRALHSNKPAPLASPSFPLHFRFGAERAAG